MKTLSSRAILQAAALLLFSGMALSQEVSLALLQPELMNAPSASATPATPEPLPLQPVHRVEIAQSKPLPEGPSHKFWDNQNKIIFAAVAASSAADFAVTRANLQSGGQELNPTTRLFGRSTAGLAANFAGETAGVMGLSYFFHKTGHHKLERLAPIANIGVSGFAVAYGLAHR